jgi:hypothetical protein
MFKKRDDVRGGDLIEHERRVRGGDDLGILELVEREQLLDHPHQFHLGARMQ